MPKHTRKRTQGSEESSLDAIEKEDRRNDIGLTQAFAPITDDAEEELADGYRPRAKSDRENDIGLTQAFAPITDEDAFTGESRFSDKLERFTEAVEAGRDFYEYEEEEAAARESEAASGDADDVDDTEDFAPVAEGGAARDANAPSPRGKAAHAGGFSYKGDTEDAYPDALESLEPVFEPSVLEDASPVVPGDAAAHARHTAGGKKAAGEVPAYVRKSHRMRRILIVVVVLLVFLLAAGGFFAVRLFQTAQTAAYQQTQQQQSSQDQSSLQQGAEGKDASTQTVKKTSAPDLTALLGLSQDAAIEKIARGAQVTSTSEVNEEGNPIKTDLRVALTDEPADTRTGTPTVYLGLDEDGLVVQAGYSAGTSALGYGTLSFSDAVKNESIIEKTLQEAGIQVPVGTVTLPADKTEYSTYASDGTTLVKEYCPFTGSIDINGTSHTWSAVLSYDYTVANASGNLADTIRIIYVYINA